MAISRLFILLLIVFETNAIILKNGGYEDVYVLIRERVKERDEIVQRIKDVLTSASQLLFTATHHQLYFRQIKIIVPKSWPRKQEYKQLPNSPLSDSFFSVDIGDNMQVPQTKGQFTCGKAGRFIHLPSAFLLSSNRTSWGHHDRVIVHEWGHLRWGLFNELPMKGKRFYLANGKWNPTRCTDEIKGKIIFKSKGKEECNINDTSKPMHEKCIFIAMPQQDVVASLMSYPFINKMSQFCDQDVESVKREHRHNSFAPTIHNEKCNYKSAWEIMRQHSDFENVAQLPETTNTTPTFEIIQETTYYRVFVLDVSGSMDSHGRLKTLQDATRTVIQNLISNGSWVGIISFSTRAKIEKDIIQVNTEQDRNALIAAIPTVATGSTCIGCGLREAAKLLTQKLGGTSNGEIFLISDGENTPTSVDVDINDARQEVIAAKITAHTIAVSQQADHLLANISHETGGKYYTYFDNGGISLLAAFSQSISSSQTSAKEENIMLMSSKVDTVSTKIHNISFAIEEGLGDDTTFTFITSTDTDVHLQLTGPNGYNQSMSSHGSIATLSIPGIAQAGEYNMNVTTNTIPRTVEYYVKSGATSGDIVRVTSTLSSNDIDLSTGELPIIYSEVSMSYLPVLNASVTARVETGDKSCDITLKDDGIDPDMLDNDGIYSGYIFPNCLHDGRINVEVKVKGQKGETQILQSVTGAPSENEDDEKIEVYDSSFQRVEILEQLKVSNYKDTTLSDTVAPGKITDVSIYHIKTELSSKAETRNFTISWTATGDDKSFGRAARYIFRIADDFDDLLNNFDNATLLDVKNASLIPKTAGETEVLKLVVDADERFTGTAFFAVQAVDDAGNKGSVSNIVSILVAKGYRAFSEEGTLEIEESDTEIEISDLEIEEESDSDSKIDKHEMVSCAESYHVLSLISISSLFLLFGLMN